MGGEWRAQTFAELIGGAENVIGGPFGSNLTQSDYTSEGVPVIRGSNMGQDGRYIGGDYAFVSTPKAELLSNNQVQGGDIVVTQRGTMGQVSIVPSRPAKRYIVSQSQMGVHVEAADPMFVYYLLRSPAFNDFLDASVIQTGVPHINMGLLRTWKVVAPSKLEQIRISQLLEVIDEKIELNQRMAETLEAMARALFRSWFVDFDPVHARAERHPTGLPDDLATLFPDSFGEDGLPEDWHQGSVAQIAALNPETWTTATIPATLHYVDLAGVKWGTIESVQVMSAADAPSRAQRVLAPGDTIVGTVRPGNGSYALISRSGLTGSTGFAALRPRIRTVREALYLAMTCRENIDALAHLADGAAYPAIRPEVVSRTPLAVPSRAIFEAFSSAAAPLLDAMSLRRLESETLANLRDTLLPKLISGELRIADAERQVAAA